MCAGLPAGLTAELDLLTQALDLPGPDLAETLIRLTADAQTAVDSYLGLSIAINANRTEFDLTILREGTQPEHVRTSLLVPLSTAAADPSTAPASVAMILFAAAPGAFIDLAADLSWITGRTLGDFRLDEHHTFPVNATNPTALGTMSSINQALGVLIGRGSTPEQAERDLHARAARAGIELLAVATLILAALTSPADEAVPDSSSLVNPQALRFSGLGPCRPPPGGRIWPADRPATPYQKTSRAGVASVTLRAAASSVPVQLPAAELRTTVPAGHAGDTLPIGITNDTKRTPAADNHVGGSCAKKVRPSLDRVQRPSTRTGQRQRWRWRWRWRSTLLNRQQHRRRSTLSGVMNCLRLKPPPRTSSTLCLRAYVSGHGAPLHAPLSARPSQPAAPEMVHGPITPASNHSSCREHPS